MSIRDTSNVTAMESSHLQIVKEILEAGKVVPASDVEEAEIVSERLLHREPPVLRRKITPHNLTSDLTQHQHQRGVHFEAIWWDSV